GARSDRRLLRLGGRWAAGLPRRRRLRGRAADGDDPLDVRNDTDPPALLVAHVRGHHLSAGAPGPRRRPARGLSHADAWTPAWLDGLYAADRQRDADGGRVAGRRAAPRLHLWVDALRRRRCRRTGRTRLPAALDQDRTFRSHRWLTSGDSTATRSAA